ncbi:hypothetical protein [Halarcobacter sp.]|uniref:hypothetical protein n=1 Tax=Halarcobacter sp. TaxID=2321133 RepID=UPI0029F49AF5|nr:hypothetical protein [Halarcobacter sp.]
MTNNFIENHIKYYDGNLPIIISAPHGGDEKPKDIKTRKKGVFEKDDYTFELTEEIIKEFEKQIQKTPYCIIATISREKVDINRKSSEAYFDEKASIPYNQFHSLIKTARAKVKREFQKGLYFDIHGQSHSHGFIEFGYLLNNDILKLKKKRLKKYKNSSSIKTLSNFSSKSFIKQIKGKNSLGTLMSKKGYKSVPSKKIPYAKDDNYFEGAFNTFKYGSLDEGVINGIQVEFPYKNCRDSKKNRKKCAKAFVKTIIKFSKIHLGINLKNINILEN